MQLWTNSSGGCLNACLASLVDVHPGDVPHSDDSWFDLEAMNEWLAPRGRRLEPVYDAGTWGASIPPGAWIALLARGPGVVHAVLCEGSRITHDPGLRDGGSGNLWPSDLAYTHDRARALPLGYQLTESIVHER